MERTNEDRRKDALDALKVHVHATCGLPDEELAEDPESCIADLVTNLMHLAKARDASWEKIQATAQMNFDAETGPCEECKDPDHGAEECDA